MVAATTRRPHPRVIGVDVLLKFRFSVVMVWIVLGVVEGLNPWKDEDHARTQEVPR